MQTLQFSASNATAHRGLSNTTLRRASMPKDFFMLLFSPLSFPLIFFFFICAAFFCIQFLKCEAHAGLLCSTGPCSLSIKVRAAFEVRAALCPSPACRAPPSIQPRALLSAAPALLAMPATHPGLLLSPECSITLWASSWACWPLWVWLQFSCHSEVQGWGTLGSSRAVTSGITPAPSGHFHVLSQGCASSGLLPYSGMMLQQNNELSMWFLFFF